MNSFFLFPFSYPGWHSFTEGEGGEGLIIAIDMTPEVITIQIKTFLFFFPLLSSFSHAVDELGVGQIRPVPADDMVAGGRRGPSPFLFTG